jgi:hypothetical protein
MLRKINTQYLKIVGCEGGRANTSENIGERTLLMVLKGVLPFCTELK